MHFLRGVCKEGALLPKTALQPGVPAATRFPSATDCKVLKTGTMGLILFKSTPLIAASCRTNEEPPQGTRSGICLLEGFGSPRCSPPAHLGANVGRGLLSGGSVFLLRFWRGSQGSSHGPFPQTEFPLVSSAFPLPPSCKGGPTGARRICHPPFSGRVAWPSKGVGGGAKAALESHRLSSHQPLSS